TERHREILDADVMDDLIVGTLCKGGVDGHEGTESLRGESGRESHGMLFADAYVREAGRKVCLEMPRPRSAGHGRGDGHDPVVFASESAERVSEDFGICGRRILRFGKRSSRLHIEFAESVKEGRMRLGWR